MSGYYDDRNRTSRGWNNATDNRESNQREDNRSLRGPYQPSVQPSGYGFDNRGGPYDTPPQPRRRSPGHRQNPVTPGSGSTRAHSRQSYNTAQQVSLPPVPDTTTPSYIPSSFPSQNGELSIPYRTATYSAVNGPASPLYNPTTASSDYMNNDYSSQSTEQQYTVVAVDVHATNDASHAQRGQRSTPEDQEDLRLDGHDNPYMPRDLHNIPHRRTSSGTYNGIGSHFIQDRPNTLNNSRLRQDSDFHILGGATNGYPLDGTLTMSPPQTPRSSTTSMSVNAGSVRGSSEDFIDSQQYPEAQPNDQSLSQIRRPYRQGRAGPDRTSAGSTSQGQATSQMDQARDQARRDAAYYPPPSSSTSPRSPSSPSASSQVPPNSAFSRGSHNRARRNSQSVLAEDGPPPPQYAVSRRRRSSVVVPDDTRVSPQVSPQRARYRPEDLLPPTTGGYTYQPLPPQEFPPAPWTGYQEQQQQLPQLPQLPPPRQQQQQQRQQQQQPQRQSGYRYD